MSVPVKNNGESYVGFVDMLDIICYVFSNMKDKDESARKINFIQTPIREIVNFSKMNPWCPVYTGKPLLSIMDMFSSIVKLQRIPIIDDQGKVLSVISRSKVIEFLNFTIKNFGSIANKQVFTCFPAKHVESISCDMSVFDAFNVIYTKKISGLAVVNAQGALVGNVSASDMKSIVVADLYNELRQPLNLLMKRSSDIFGKPFRALYCYPDDTLQQVLQIFVNENIHRCYIMDKNKKPMGVISLGDMIELLERIDVDMI